MKDDVLICIFPSTKIEHQKWEIVSPSRVAQQWRQKKIRLLVLENTIIPGGSGEHYSRLQCYAQDIMANGLSHLPRKVSIWALISNPAGIIYEEGSSQAVKKHFLIYFSMIFFHMKRANSHASHFFSGPQQQKPRGTLALDVFLLKIFHHHRHFDSRGKLLSRILDTFTTFLESCFSTRPNFSFEQKMLRIKLNTRSQQRYDRKIW